MASAEQHRDVHALLVALFDIRSYVKDIRDFLLGEDDGEEEEEAHA